MELQRNVVGWFEVPVTDMDRAIKFYETVFDFKIQKQNLGDIIMGWFPYADLPGSPGSLVYHKDFYKPSPDGVLIYFTAQSGDLNNELAKVESAGGKILQQKKLIAEDIGYMGLFIDTEGNRIAIHSRN
jgi:predicted enzyme related to lactoylglutathione lyase